MSTNYDVTVGLYIISRDVYRHAFSEKPMADVASMVVRVRGSSYVLRINEAYVMLCVTIYYTVYRLGCLRWLVWGMVCVVGWLNFELGAQRFGYRRGLNN